MNMNGLLCRRQGLGPEHQEHPCILQQIQCFVNLGYGEPAKCSKLVPPAVAGLRPLEEGKLVLWLQVGCPAWISSASSWGMVMGPVPGKGSWPWPGNVLISTPERRTDGTGI